MVFHRFAKLGPTVDRSVLECSVAGIGGIVMHYKCAQNPLNLISLWGPKGGPKVKTTLE